MNRDDTSKPAAAGPLSDHERADLVLMREEERLARDLYRRFHQAWDVPIFANIAASEQRHYDAIGRLLKRYNVPDPSAGKPPGVYADTELQGRLRRVARPGTVLGPRGLRGRCRTRDR
ncbi:DUF2202 domain-containing protein [Mycobacterium sp. THU-M104]|uniref:DUF2202 domain-containing protein n=1 Tax=Mycobacterium sp. THU-M104 TaxID=3410515 RepID=UPI003B98F0AF